jgi:tetratricopeptide (TPR) repeat protein
LITQQRRAQALEIFKLNTRLFPASANVFDSLAELQEIMGSRQEAIDSYQKVLELDPDNANATTRIQALRSTSG